MEKKREFISDFFYCFGDKVWTIDINRYEGIKRDVLHFIKLIRITFDHFAEKRLGFQAAALSYFGFLALIPLIAVIFTITNGFGLTTQLRNIFTSFFENNTTIINIVIEKADNIINQAQSDWIGILSALMFLWAILWFFYQIERVFNFGYDRRKTRRKVYKRISFYLGLILLLPFVLLLFLTGIATYANLLRYVGFDAHEHPYIKSFIGWFLFYLFGVLVLASIFKTFPATKVKFGKCFKSALIFSAIFVGFQYLYIETQTFVSRMSKVYGVIAAVPLYLIWMNFSWQIIIYGEQFTYAMEKISSYLPEHMRHNHTNAEKK